MDKQTFLQKTEETLKPFETENLLNTMQTLTLQQIFTNPIVLGVIVLLLFFGIYKRSTTVLLTLFGMVGMIVMARYAIPAANTESSLSSIVPFVFFGVIIGGVIIYFSMIKSD